MEEIFLLKTLILGYVSSLHVIIIKDEERFNATIWICKENAVKNVDELFFFLSTILLILLEMLKLAALLLEYDTGKKKERLLFLSWKILIKRVWIESYLKSKKKRNKKNYSKLWVLRKDYLECWKTLVHLKDSHQNCSMKASILRKED